MSNATTLRRTFEPDTSLRELAYGEGLYNTARWHAEGGDEGEPTDDVEAIARATAEAYIHPGSMETPAPRGPATVFALIAAVEVVRRSARAS